MAMKIKQIQAFLTVASEGNLTLAAEKMGITQSGLSRLLLTLEEDLNATLFERHKHGMALSEYGSAFFTLCHDNVEYGEQGQRGDGADPRGGQGDFENRLRIQSVNQPFY